MTSQRYYICKKNKNGGAVYIDYNKIQGFNVSPKNEIKYDGIEVNKVVIINPSMIEKILRRKIKKKLDLYLRLIIDFIDSDSTDGDTIREALNDLSKYKNIVNYKYRKYLDSKYFTLLCKKIEILELELKDRFLNIKTIELERENKPRKSR